VHDNPQVTPEPAHGVAPLDDDSPVIATSKRRVLVVDDYAPSADGLC
jgi:hypothetical protein